MTDMPEKPTLYAFPGVTAGADLCGEPICWHIIVRYKGKQIYDVNIPNPFYVAPPPPSELDKAMERVREAQDTLLESVNALLDLELDS